jgi:hypothetical protein
MAISEGLGGACILLLKWQYQPEKRSGRWRSSIRNARIAIAERLEESPSLKSYPETVLLQCYRTARANAADETGLPLATFPETPPFSLEEILSEEFLPCG